MVNLIMEITHVHSGPAGVCAERKANAAHRLWTRAQSPERCSIGERGEKAGDQKKDSLTWDVGPSDPLVKFPHFIEE